MNRAATLLTTSVCLIALLSACGDQTEPAQHSHNHPHLHGPMGGELVKVADDLWIEFQFVHDEQAMIMWTYSGAHEGDLKAMVVASPPTLSFAHGGKQISIASKHDPGIGDNAYRFNHEALEGDIPGASVNVVKVAGGEAMSAVLPDHHH